MMTSASWEGQDHPMSGAGEDDFGHFLDMSAMGDGMQFDFNGAFPDGSAQAMMADPAAQNIMPQGDGMMHSQGQHQMATPTGGHSAGPGPMVPNTAASGDPISNIDAQIQYLQQQKFQQQQRQIQEQRNAYFTHHSVPPTPQSLEMPPGSGQFYSQHDAYDTGYQNQRQRVREQQDMAFTPLVSPAVTPLDPHFNMENAFTVPGAYFSPLTSPALHAQTDMGSGYDHSTNSNNSPIEMDLEAAPAPVASTLELSKKARKNNAAKSRAKAPSVKSSPITKPQRKKAGPSPAIVSQVLNEVDERSHSHVMDLNLLPLPAASTDGSEDASVSPENLTDMPPPPIPAWKSAGKSPFMQPQNGNAPTSAPATDSVVESQPASTAAPHTDPQPNPATPASLMRLASSKSKRSASNQHDQTATDNIESLDLPESISNKQFAPIDAQITPTESPRIQPNPNSSHSQPSPAPNKRPGTKSATQSPQILPGSTGPSARKTPNIAPRGARKGSVQVSPALLPRISPNIKPLLPGGDSAESDASRLLMSKSNYQNILEGNTVPGVHYPTELSSNLTSKRTSHKIAEQGRRNRINTALQVMASLLPDHDKMGPVEGDDDDKKDGKQANASNGKASVVEKAIVHVQHLEAENSGLKKEVQDLKDQLEKLKAPS